MLLQTELKSCKAFTSLLFFIIRANGMERGRLSLTVDILGIKGKKTICINKVRHFLTKSGPKEDKTEEDLE